MKKQFVIGSKTRGHTKSGMATRGSTKVIKRQKIKRKLGQSLYFSFHGNSKVKGASIG